MLFTIEGIRQVLAPPGDGILRQRAWLQASLGDPEGFARALFRDAAEQAESPYKSQYGIGYDLYHDAVVRHATGPAAERPCFLYAGEPPLHDAAAPLQAITYAHLHAATTVLASQWRQRGASPGEVICILYPMGPELLVALCAALKLGLVPCVLPPLGVDFLGKRLHALKPQHLVTARRYHGLLREWYQGTALPLGDAVMPEPHIAAASAGATRAAAQELWQGIRQDASASHSYAPRAAALLAFSPLRDLSHVPCAVAAQAVFLGALCDGLLLGLHHGGSTLAAPGHSSLQYQPLLLLLLLLHGATYVHIPAEALAGGAPRARPLPRIDALLVSARLRDQLMQLPPRPLLEVRSCVVQVTESASPILWRDFIERAQLGAVPFLTWHYDAACAGALLFSLRQRGVAPQLFHPAPGRPFLLGDPRVEEAPAQGPHGILRPLPGACGLLLYEHAGGYLYGGTRAPSRAGATLARDEVEAVVAAVPWVAGAVLVPDPSDRGTSTLLTFVGPHLRDKGADFFLQLEHAIRERIRSRMGDDFLPTSVQVLASLPRRDKKGINFEWCQDQLRAGQLVSRATDPVLSLIDELSFASHRVATPAGRLALMLQNKPG